MQNDRTVAELTAKLAQAREVIAHLLDKAAVNGAEAHRALDYFAGPSFDKDFLPWPRPATTETRRCKTAQRANISLLPYSNRIACSALPFRFSHALQRSVSGHSCLHSFQKSGPWFISFRCATSCATR